MPVESLSDFVKKHYADMNEVDERVRQTNEKVETDPKKAIIHTPLKSFKQHAPKPEFTESRGETDEKEEKPQEEELRNQITQAKVPAGIDEEKQKAVERDGFNWLRFLAFEGFLNNTVSEMHGNDNAYVRKIETGFEGRDNMALMQVYDKDSGERETDAVYKSEGKNGAQGVFNDSNSASGRIAKELNLNVINTRTYIPPKKREDSLSLSA